jgi:hypothetical protein
VQRLSSQAADFPATATAPGVTFKYNSKLEVFEPAEENFTPPFVEDPRTQGHGRFELGFSYLFLDFDELDGDDIDHIQFVGLAHNDCCVNPPSPGNPGFENDTADVFYERFKLQSHVFAFSGTYGLTDVWDVNVLVPILYTEIDLVARAELRNTTAFIHAFDASGATTERRSVSGDHFGVGDLQLRTKYRFFEESGFRLAGSLALRVPSGSEEDFQGTGDTKITPAFAASQSMGPVDFHVASGIEVDVEETDRTRVRYAGGMTYQAVNWLGLFADIIGSSNIEEERFSVKVPQFQNIAGVETLIGFAEASEKSRTDIVDVAPGVKVRFAPSAVAFFQAFIPINDDGLRTSFTPAGGIQISF